VEAEGDRRGDLVYNVGVSIKQSTEMLLCCRYTNRQSAEVLVLDEPSRMESAILGMLRMVQCGRGLVWL
jgi:hypothetical protein